VNTFLMLVQSFFDYQTRLQANNLKEAGIRAAETGRRMAIAGILFASAGAFLFSALLIALIDMGLQIDRSRTVGFSGLMLASLILFAISLFCIFCGWLTGRESKTPVVPRAAPQDTFQSELRPLLEAVAVGLLKEFLEHQNRKHARAEAQTQSPSGESAR
jgi:hypothetical protein